HQPVAQRIPGLTGPRHGTDNTREAAHRSTLPPPGRMHPYASDITRVLGDMVDSEIKLNEKDAVHLGQFCAVCKGSCSTVILQVRHDALRAFLAAADSAKLSCETRRLGRRIGQTRPRLCVGAIPALRSCRTRRGTAGAGAWW